MRCAEIIASYTREAGVRNLEREIGSVLRNVAVRITEGTGDQVHVDRGPRAEILGAPRFESEVALRTSMAGVATGLAWTPVGGDILFVETTAVRGKGGLILTGQLGDVMKESAQAAVTLVKSRAESLGLADFRFDEHDLHIHVPAGAIPKDGPSAGVALFTSVCSLLTGQQGPERRGHDRRDQPARPGAAGRRHQGKVPGRAAGRHPHRAAAGRNRKDLEDIPESARQQLEFVWLETVDDALARALEPHGAGCPTGRGGVVECANRAEHEKGRGSFPAAARATVSRSLRRSLGDCRPARRDRTHRRWRRSPGQPVCAGAAARVVRYPQRPARRSFSWPTICSAACLTPAAVPCRYPLIALAPWRIV